MQTPLDADSPGCRPLRCRPPSPGFRYSQQVGGTHPTGLHTCFVINLIPADVLLQLTNMAIYPRTHMYQAYANFSETRMHSSRMRTARSSSRLLGGGCLPQCMLGYPWVWTWRLETAPQDVAQRPPQVWAWRPPQVWAWTPPMPDPSNSCLGVGWRPARHAGIPPPLETCRACWDTSSNT